MDPTKSNDVLEGSAEECMMVANTELLRLLPKFTDHAVGSPEFTTLLSQVRVRFHDFLNKRNSFAPGLICMGNVSEMVQSMRDNMVLSTFVDIFEFVMNLHPTSASVERDNSKLQRYEAKAPHVTVTTMSYKLSVSRPIRPEHAEAEALLEDFQDPAVPAAAEVPVAVAQAGVAAAAAAAAVVDVNDAADDAVALPENHRLIVPPTHQPLAVPRSKCSICCKYWTIEEEEAAVDLGTQCCEKIKGKFHWVHPWCDPEVLCVENKAKLAKPSTKYTCAACCKSWKGMIVVAAAAAPAAPPLLLRLGVLSAAAAAEN